MIKFLHLLSVILFCTIKLIECSGPIYEELKKYYDSDIQRQFQDEWGKYRRGFENEIASNVRENFGTSALNIYEPGKHTAHLLARGFQLTDGVVMVYFDEMVLRYLPDLLRPKLEMTLPSNFLKFESRLGRMFIDTTYYVARNSTSIVYARPEDQKFLSPFSLQQVDTIGKVVIVAEDCLLSGIAISTLSGDSVSLGHNPFSIIDCKLMVEISTPNSGAPPVIAPYFSPGPKELLEMIIANPIRDELQTKLQGAMYSYINTSVLFDQAAVYRNNQQKLFKSYAEFMRKYVADLNRNTIILNKTHVNLPDYEVTMNTETNKSRLWCRVALTDIVLYGLDTAYVTRAGGPFNDGSTNTAADAIIFSSMQIRGKITHDDENGTSTKDFAVELTDVTVILAIDIEKGRTNLLQIHFTGWRSLDFSIIPRQTSNKDRHDHQALVYGYILNELPVRVLDHVTSIIGHGPIDGNKKDTGDASGHNGGGNGSGGDNGGGGDNGTGDDNGGDNGRGADENRSGENGDFPTTKSDNKAKGFFSDHVLDDNFFSDDNLDKNFFSDDMDKNFFNDSKETTPNEGYDVTNIDDGNDEIITTSGYDKDTISAVTGSDYKDNDTNGDDGENGGEVSNDKVGDDENTGDDTNGGVDDIGKYPIEENKPASDDEEPENTNLEHGDGDEDKPAGDDEEPENTNLEHDNGDKNKPAGDDENIETDFFSDDFLNTDFFSDDDFGADIGGKDQDDATGNKDDVEGNDGNDKDQIDNADNGNDEPDVNVSNGNQEDEDNKNIDGNNEDVAEDDNGKDTHSPVDNADDGNEEPDVNDDSEGQLVNENNVNDDEENVAGDDTKRPAGNGANSYFSDDGKPFFSDDVLEKDFFSGENIKGDKKTLKGTLDNNFFSGDDTNGEKKTLKNKQNEGDNENFEDSDGINDKGNVDKGKKRLWVFASGEDKKDVKLSGESFFSDVEFDLDSGDGSRRHLAQDKNTANERDPRNRDVVDKKRTILTEEKHTSKENVTKSLEDSREGKKVVLQSNVHNTRRSQNVHTSDNEIR